MLNRPRDTWLSYSNGMKIGGVKISIDGSPQGKTAAFITPYLVFGPNGEQGWKGELFAPQEAINAGLKKVYELDVPVLFHVNGDAAIDALIKSHEAAASGSLDKQRNITAIHAQFTRKDQIPAYVKYGIRPSYFTLHTFYFADAHRKQRGRAQTDFISPMRASIDAGLGPTNHTDAVVVPLDQMFVLWTSVNRLSRGGEVIGADQRVSPYEGLLSMTLWAAEQYGEEASKGSIATGKCADLVILSADPAKVAPETIKDIKSGADDQGRQGDLDGIRSGRDLIRRYFVFGSAIGAPPWMTPKRSANDGAFRTEGLLLPASLAHSVRVSARDMVPLTGEDHPPCFETCLRKLRRTRVWSR